MIQGLRWYEGKRLLANVRGSDYAHAGEEEAIIQCLTPFKKDMNKLILDVGCGQGGTANFIQQQGWGKVTGFDIEEKSIEYAQEKYPSIEFVTTDVLCVDKILANRKFDLLCLFNSFYAFPDQLNSLKKLHSVAKEESELIIFEYVDLTLDGNCPLIIKNNPDKAFLPIRFDTITDLGRKSGWTCHTIKDLSFEYKIWYEHLLNLIDNQKEELIMQFGEDGYNKALDRYTKLYQAIDEEILGGCIVYARYA